MVLLKEVASKAGAKRYATYTLPNGLLEQHEFSVKVSDDDVNYFLKVLTPLLALPGTTQSVPWPMTKEGFLAALKKLFDK